MASIDLTGLNIDQLTDLVGKAQSEMASREKQRRKDLRSELERRVTAEGYKMRDIFPELGNGAAGGRQRRKMPVKFRNPQNPDETWTGDRAVAEVGAGDPRRTGDRHGGVQGDSDVSDSRVGAETREHFTHPLSRSSVSKGCGFPIPTRVSGACVRDAWALASDSASMGGRERSSRLARSTPSLPLTPPNRDKHHRCRDGSAHDRPATAERSIRSALVGGHHDREQRATQPSLPLSVCAVTVPDIHSLELSGRHGEEIESTLGMMAHFSSNPNGDLQWQ